MNREPPNNLQTLWQNQPIEPTQLSPEEIRVKAARFQRTVRYRNLREYIAAVVVIVLFSRYAWNANTWLAQVASALIVAGALYIMFQLYTRAASLRGPGAESGAETAESCARFHLRELERQRDMLRTIWRWYLGPLVPGVLVMFLNVFLAAWGKGSFAIVITLASALIPVLIFFAVWRFNAVGARKLQHEIDAIELEMRPPRTSEKIDL